MPEQIRTFILHDDEIETLKWMLSEHRAICHSVTEERKCKAIMDSLARKFGVFDSEEYQSAIRQNDHTLPLLTFLPPETIHKTGVFPANFNILMIGEEE